MSSAAARQMRKRADADKGRLLLVMVGLPARGKSYIGKKLCAYLRWSGRRARVFNVGERRRRAASGTVGCSSASFFDPNNAEARALRESVALRSLGEALDWLDDEGDVAVFDATNSSRRRRRSVADACAAREGVRLLCIESMCDDEALLLENMRQKVAHSPDYAGMDPALAMADLERRLDNYAKAYEEVQDDEQLPYIKLINLNSKVVVQDVFGRTERAILYYVMSLHIATRPVWLVRAGAGDGLDATTGAAIPEREGDRGGRGGLAPSFLAAPPDGEASPDSAMHLAGSPKSSLSVAAAAAAAAAAAFPESTAKTRHSIGLSADGAAFSRRLAAFVASHRPLPGGYYEAGDTHVLCSTIDRARATIQHVGADATLHSGLSMIDRGLCEGVSTSDLALMLPTVYRGLREDPYRCRYPGGESYEDVRARLEPIVVEVERHSCPVLVVAHLSSLRPLYAYFAGLPPEQSPHIDVPQHTVLQFVSSNYGWTETRIPLGAPPRTASEESPQEALAAATAAVAAAEAADAPLPLRGTRSDESGRPAGSAAAAAAADLHSPRSATVIRRDDSSMRFALRPDSGGGGEQTG